MKRIICVILIAILALSATACSKIGKIIDVLFETEAPTVTDVPATEAPTVTEGPGETDDPNATDIPDIPDPDEDFIMLLDTGVEYDLDLDSDGLDDNLIITSSEVGDWGERGYTVKITLGCNKEHPLEYQINYCDEFYACVLDSYPGDSRAEVLISFMQDSDDWTTVGFRVNDTIPEIDVFEKYFCVSKGAMLDFTAKKGFEAFDSTDVWGTHSVRAYFKVGQFGFDMLSVDYTYYIYDDDDCALTLERSLDAYVLNDDGTKGAAVNVAAGEKILPIRTDNATYVVMKVVSTGQLIIADVEIHSWSAGYDDWGIFISGVNQDEYAEILYAD